MFAREEKDNPQQLTQHALEAIKAYDAFRKEIEKTKGTVLTPKATQEARTKTSALQETLKESIKKIIVKIGTLSDEIPKAKNMLCLDGIRTKCTSMYQPIIAELKLMELTNFNMIAQKLEISLEAFQLAISVRENALKASSKKQGRDRYPRSFVTELSTTANQIANNNNNNNNNYGTNQEPPSPK